MGRFLALCGLVLASCVSASFSASAFVLPNSMPSPKASSSFATCLPEDVRQDCGFPGISQKQCEHSGCCFDNSTTEVWCSYPECTMAADRCVHGTCTAQKCVCEEGWMGSTCNTIVPETVYVIQSCHLDVGFAQSAPDIVNLWFGYFSYAISVAAELESSGTDARLKFMAQAYIVSLFLDCPPGMGLHCPNATQIAAFQEAVRKGVIWWHAFPFNAELEIMSPLMISEAVNLSHTLQDNLGVPRVHTLSQRDVPGISAAAIPHLRKAGVTAVSVGVNGASTPPHVPKLFNWQDPASGESVVAAWHPYGYGGIDVNSAISVPAAKAVLVFDWNGDNAGPFSASVYKSHFSQLHTQFPGAKIVAATWDDFMSLAEASKDSLPVIRNEIGDSWIYGVPSDPVKVARVRALHRAWDSYIAQGGPRDAVYLNATRLAIKNGEHTWGSDVKRTLLAGETGWSNKDFEAARVSASVGPQYTKLEASWWRQRAWGIRYPIEALHAAKHPLGRAVDAELAQLTPEAPSQAVLDGYTLVKNLTGPFYCESYTVGFDSSGAIIELVDAASGTSWASPSNPLLKMEYRTYDGNEVENFIAEYVLTSASWAQHDFGKPNVTSGNPVSEVSRAVVDKMFVRKSSSHTSFLMNATVGPDLTRWKLAGAPKTVWIQVDVPRALSTVPIINVTYTLLEKTPTRLPEAMLLTSLPYSPASTSPGDWSMNKLGEWLPFNETISGGSQHLHGIDSGVAYKSGSATLHLNPLDAAVVCAGQPTDYPVPTNASPDLAKYGLSSVMYGNLWGTNYIMWTPYANTSSPYPVAQEPHLKYRYQLSVTPSN